MKQLLVIFLLIASAVSFAQDATGVDAKIEQLLTLSGAEDQFVQAIDHMLSIQRQQASFASIPAAYWDTFGSEMKTTSQQIVTKQVKIMTESMQVGAEWGQAVAARIIKELQEKAGEN